MHWLSVSADIDYCMEQLKPDFVRMLAQLLGPSGAEALACALDTPPAVAVRRNSAKTDALPSRLPVAHGVPLCPDGAVLSTRPRFALMPLWHTGAFYVQEPSSMIAGAIAARLAAMTGQKGLRWLDVCAAPGGKTTAVLSALPPDAFVVANEYDPRRATVLAENVAKWGRPNVAVTRGDTTWLRKMRDGFHVVAVDAPCSGEGMMRKDAEARTQWSESLVRSCAATQRKILADAFDALMPGGYLVYSTCTFNRLENEDNVAWLMAEYDAESIAVIDPAEAGAAPSVEPAIHALRFMPHISEGEGLFIAVVRKPGILTPSRPTKKPGKKVNTQACAQAAVWLDKATDLTLATDTTGIVSAVPSPHAGLVRHISTAAPAVLSAGVKVATVKGRDLIPMPELALSTILRPGSFPTAEMTDDEALDYLRRGTDGAMRAIGRHDSQLPKGYVLMTCGGGTPLGFVKYMGNRINSLYPVNWRLRTL